MRWATVRSTDWFSAHATTLTSKCVADCDDGYLDTVIRKWDKDGSGSVDFEEFQTMYAQELSPPAAPLF